MCCKLMCCKLNVTFPNGCELRPVDPSYGTAMTQRRFPRIIICTAALLVSNAPFVRADSPQAANPAPREIRVDVAQTKGPLNRAYRFSVGSDRAIIHLRPEHQRDLKFVRETCGFEHMRFHGLLNEEMHLVKSRRRRQISL